MAHHTFTAVCKADEVYMRHPGTSRVQARAIPSATINFHHAPTGPHRSGVGGEREREKKREKGGIYGETSHTALLSRVLGLIFTREAHKEINEMDTRRRYEFVQDY